MSVASILSRKRHALLGFWVRAGVGCAIRIAALRGWDPATAIIAIGVGVPLGHKPLRGRQLAEYNAGIRRPVERDGIRILEAMKDYIWMDRTGRAGYYDGVARRQRYQGWVVVARLGNSCGVVQVIREPRAKSSGTASQLQNIWIPAPEVYLSNKMLRNLPEEDLIKAFEMYDTFLREDGMSPYEAENACSRL